MDIYEAEVMRFLTDNGKRQLAVIPQYAVPPNESWSIDFLAFDLKNKKIIFVEVTKTPNQKLIDKINERAKWIAVTKRHLVEETSVVTNSWEHIVWIFVPGNSIGKIQGKIVGEKDYDFFPLKACLPQNIFS